MANIEIPKDAFIVKGPYTKYHEAERGQTATKRYNKFLSEALDAGYDIAQSMQMAEEDLKRYFTMFMEKYYPMKESFKGYER